MPVRAVVPFGLRNARSGPKKTWGRVWLVALLCPAGGWLVGSGGVVAVVRPPVSVPQTGPPRRDTSSRAKVRRGQLHHHFHVAIFCEIPVSVSVPPSLSLSNHTDGWKRVGFSLWSLNITGNSKAGAQRLTWTHGLCVCVFLPETCHHLPLCVCQEMYGGGGNLQNGRWELGGGRAHDVDVCLFRPRHGRSRMLTFDARPSRHVQLLCTVFSMYIQRRASSSVIPGPGCAFGAIFWGGDSMQALNWRFV